MVRVAAFYWLGVACALSLVFDPSKFRVRW